ncbi:MAG TPA: hypothetical protein VGW74_09330 [Propionibacteriaceae bacterium]|nr:hypothetical protein [Propionibacteriaceae bacterium]
MGSPPSGPHDYVGDGVDCDTCGEDWDDPWHDTPTEEERMSDTAHLVPEHPGDRGFKHMPKLVGAYEGDSVRVIESSLADGPHVGLWVKRQPSQPTGVGLPPADVHVPLDADTAWKLKEQIEWLLEHHYHGDARPGLPAAVDTGRIVTAARRLLDNVTPFISALEVEHDADGVQLYGDLAEAIGLPRGYRPGAER